MVALNFNKKGNVISDVLFLIVIFFVFCLVVFVGAQFTNDLNTDIQASADFDNTSKEFADDLNTRYPTFFDGLILFILILLWILVIVASFNIDAHPIFFAVMLILFIFVMIVVIDIGNTFEDITSDTELTSFRASFPITIWIFDNLIYVAIAFAVTIMLVLYGKTRI